MRNDKYKVAISGAITIFEFVSQGPKGRIKKRVQYQATKQKNLFNLAFGDINPETNEIDDKVVTNNKDSLKVLSTVACNKNRGITMNKTIEVEAPDFSINHELDKYEDVIMFPEKLQRANEMIERYGLPKKLEERLLLRKKQKAFWTKGILTQADADKNTFVLLATDEDGLTKNAYPITVVLPETLTKLVKNYWNGIAQVHIKPKTLDENETEYDLIDVNWRTW